MGLRGLGALGVRGLGALGVRGLEFRVYWFRVLGL